MQVLIEYSPSPPHSPRFPQENTFISLHDDNFFNYFQQRKGEKELSQLWLFTHQRGAEES